MLLLHLMLAPWLPIYFRVHHQQCTAKCSLDRRLQSDCISFVRKQKLEQRAERFGTAPISWHIIDGEPVAFSSGDAQHNVDPAAHDPHSSLHVSGSMTLHVSGTTLQQLATTLQQHRRRGSDRRNASGCPCRHGRGGLERGDNADAADAALQHPRAGEGPIRPHRSTSVRDPHHCVQDTCVQLKMGRAATCTAFALVV